MIVDASFYNSGTLIKNFLQERGIGALKKFGQNFLLNENARKKIVNALSSYDTVWEIGPGLGALTYLLQEKTNQLVLFEIDYSFVQILKEFFSGLLIIQGDALKTIPLFVKQNNTPSAIVSNLPYNVGAHIIGMLIQNSILPESMVFTLQKEVVSRMLAKVGSKDYSVFTLVCELDYQMKKVMDIGESSFYPVPNVISSVILLQRKKERFYFGKSLDDKDIRAIYFMLAHTLFLSRRKTVKNNLIQGAVQFGISKEILFDCATTAGIDLASRGETVSFLELWHCATLIYEAKSKR